MELQEFLNQIQQSPETMGLLGVISAALMLTIKAMRLDAFQRKLPNKIQWEGMPKVVRTGIVVVFSFVGALITSMAGDVSFLASMPMAIAAALGAMGMHSAVKK